MTRHAALASFGSLAHGTPALRAWPGETGLSFLLCSRIRQSLDKHDTQVLTVEQVRRSLNHWLQYHDLLWAAREARGITLDQLQEMTGIHKSQLSKLLSADGNPTLYTLNRVADALGKNWSSHWPRNS